MRYSPAWQQRAEASPEEMLSAAVREPDESEACVLQRFLRLVSLVQMIDVSGRAEILISKIKLLF